MKRIIAILTCFITRNHPEEKAVIVVGSKIHAFQCKRCGKPIGIPLPMEAKNAGTSLMVWKKTAAILATDRINSIHKLYDKKKALV
jgi:hypothetical protein